MRGHILALVLTLFNMVKALSYPDPNVKLLRQRRSQYADNLGEDPSPILSQSSYDNDRSEDHLLHFSKRYLLLQPPLSDPRNNYYNEEHRFLHYKRSPPHLPSLQDDDKYLFPPSRFPRLPPSDKLPAKNKIHVPPFLHAYPSFSFHSKQSDSHPPSLLDFEKDFWSLNRFHPLLPSHKLSGRNRTPLSSYDGYLPNSGFLLPPIGPPSRQSHRRYQNKTPSSSYDGYLPNSGFLLPPIGPPSRQSHRRYQNKTPLSSYDGYLPNSGFLLPPIGLPSRQSHQRYHPHKSSGNHLRPPLLQNQRYPYLELQAP
ncbi:uncharacterized protein [Diabrotica undecimpunctata]|uniref:uncharacterized protein n=1 Tax=Diabrotica undecimpunctata TaxID=50387 RepID=UPI003B640E01